MKSVKERHIKLTVTTKEPTQSAESEDQENQNQEIADDESKAEATFSYTIDNISKLKKWTYSPKCMVRNLPWKIMAQLRISGKIYGDKSLAFFLQCNAESDSTSWSCNATAKLKVLNQKPDGNDFQRKIQHLFSPDENDWGYSAFLDWNELLNPNKGYCKDDRVTLQVHVIADAPHGVRLDKMELADGIVRNSGSDIEEETVSENVAADTYPDGDDKEDVDLCNPFMKKSVTNNTALLVAGHKLYASKAADVPPDSMIENVAADVPPDSMIENVAADVPPDSVIENVAADVPPDSVIENVAADVPPDSVIENVAADVPPDRMIENVAADVPPDSMIENVAADVPPDSVIENVAADVDLPTDNNNKDNPYAKKTAINNTALLVEGHKLYVSKAVLSLVSPVFRSMFELDMEDKNMDEIPLPGKGLDDMIELLECIYPNSRKPITGENAGILVPLFDEYQIDDLKVSCQRALVESCTDHTHIDTILERLLMASTYNMAQLRRKCLNLASRAETSTLKSHQIMHDLPPDIKSELWEHVADNRDTEIKSFLGMWKLLPDQETAITISKGSKPKPGQCYAVSAYRHACTTYTELYEASDPKEFSKYITPIKMAIANKFNSTLQILLELCATELHYMGTEHFLLLANIDLPDDIKNRLVSILTETDYPTL